MSESVPGQKPGEAAEPAPDEPGPATPDYGAIGQVIFGLVVAWVALIAIPGAIPINAPEDAQRIVILAVGLATVVALIMIAITWASSADLREESARIGIWCARIAVALAALQVVMVLLVPADSPYRTQALAIGLLVILGSALLAMTRVPSGDGLLSGLRLSNLSVFATVIAIGLIGAYLVMISNMFGLVPNSDDTAWIRYTDLRTGIESLAFAAAGALFGTTVQRQVTAEVEGDRDAADAAADELDKGVEKVKADIEAGRLVAVDHGEMTALVEDALLLPSERFTQASVRRDHASRVAEAMAAPATDVLANLREHQARARSLRRAR